MKHIIGNINYYFTESLQNISNLLMVQDYNARNKLLMDEWSFQGLLGVLSRLHIPLQAPTVVGQKGYIPSTFIAFLHTTKILVKERTLRFVMQKQQSVMWSFISSKPLVYQIPSSPFFYSSSPVNSSHMFCSRYGEQMAYCDALVSLQSNLHASPSLSL